MEFSLNPFKWFQKSDINVTLSQSAEQRLATLENDFLEVQSCLNKCYSELRRINARGYKQESQHKQEVPMMILSPGAAISPEVLAQLQGGR